jgi:uncharacterized membrane protein
MQWYFLLGMATGMRTMTGIAVVCWFGWLGLLSQQGWSLWLAHPVCVIVFTLFALGEYYVDTLPITPNRTDLPLLLARCLFGGFAGAMAARALIEPWAGGALFALIGVFFGAFGGLRLRLWGARRVGRDLPVALSESALAIALAILGAYMLHRGMIYTSIAQS